MTAVRAILAFMQGERAYREKAARRLAGSPFMLRLTYLGGHPGIHQTEPFWVGCVSNQLRLVDQQGDLCYDLPISRICGMRYDQEGRLHLRFEPTAGLVATLAFQAEGSAGETYQKLCHLMMIGA